MWCSGRKLNSVGACGPEWKTSEPVSAMPQRATPSAAASSAAIVRLMASSRQSSASSAGSGGTATRAGQGAPYLVAGKTGTAQVVGMKSGEKYDEKRVKEHHRDHALFIAYAPADDPKIALALLVENGGHGGSTAAPIAREVFDYYLLAKRPEKKPVLGDEEAVGD